MNADAAKPNSTKDKQLLLNRWGEDVIAEGWSGVPSILFKFQNRLGLENNHLVILLHLLDHWIGANGEIRPEIKSIANRMGMSVSRTRFLIAELENNGFLERKPRFENKKQLANLYSLDGLVKKLKQYGPELKDAREYKIKQEKRKNPQA
jgi:DNA-binding MarR family transcriptional regulator